MDRSTRNLLISILLVVAIFVAVDRVSSQASIGDWWLVLLFLLFALAVWAYERYRRQGYNDSEVAETVIEPVTYERDSLAAPVAPVMAASVAAAPVPTPSIAVVEPAPPAPVAEQHPPAAAAVVTTIEEKAAPPPSAPAAETDAVMAATAPAGASLPSVPVAEAVATPEPAPAKPAPKPKAKAAPAKKEASGKPDNLKLVEGIGPKMEKALNAAGISTFAQLASATEDQINAAIVAGGMRFAPSVPTWAEQASFAANGDFEGMEAFKKTLTGGRKA